MRFHSSLALFPNPYLGRPWPRVTQASPGDLEVLARELGDDVTISPEAIDSAWPRLALRRAVWPSEAGQSLVAVTLEWTQRIDPAGAETPYVGVRVHVSNPHGKALDRPLRDEFSGSADLAARGFKLRGNAWWPVLRRLPKNPEWWQDAPAWLASVRDAHREAWELAAPTIDRVVGMVVSSPEAAT